MNPMDELIKYYQFLTENHNYKVFYLVFILLWLFLIYLICALFIHRKDRKELEREAISTGVDVLFKYSWRGVELKISHPTDRSRPPTQGNQPP